MISPLKITLFRLDYRKWNAKPFLRTFYFIFFFYIAKLCIFSTLMCRHTNGMYHMQVTKKLFSDDFVQQSKRPFLRYCPFLPLPRHTPKIFVFNSLKRVICMMRCFDSTALCATQPTLQTILCAQVRKSHN